MLSPRICASLCIALLVGGCANAPKSASSSKLETAGKCLKAARGKLTPVQERAADYLQAAALSDSVGNHSSAEDTRKARLIYNASAAELTHLLRAEDGGKYWNHPLKLTAGQGTYWLRTEQGGSKAFWSPNFFTSFIPADQINERHFRKPDRQDGIGGSLLGVRAPAKREPFAPKRGIPATVTATLEFTGTQARLALRNPVEQPAVQVRGKTLPLNADFSAPLAFHPPVNEFWNGFRAMIRVEKYMSGAGLYFLEPYDPDKIPLIFVHGLMSTGFMWRNVANEIEADPELRRRYQVWVFNYPTGNPVLYSALRLREELAKVEQLCPAPKHGYVIVGHSMGGLLARVQATSSGRLVWDYGLKEHAAEVDAKLPKDHLFRRLLVFEANPKVDLLVFICVPHRGSEIALGSIGALGRKLIRLPTTVTEVFHSVADTLGDSLTLIAGGQPLPTSIDSLSPKNTTLLALDKLPMGAPFHSIIGDRGKGNTPNSSDGVVPYWSSHLDHAQSELIVPGPHGSHEMPQTIAELKRILHLHLKSLL